MKRLALILTASVAVIAMSLSARAANPQLFVFLDIDCNNIRMDERLNEVFRAELAKIPDVVLVTQGHWDLDIMVLADVTRDGHVYFATRVSDHDSEWMAIRDSGVDMDKVRDSIHARGFSGVYTEGYIGISLVLASELKEMVSVEVAKINQRDFQRCRQAIAAYGRVTTDRPKDAPSQAPTPATTPFTKTSD